MHSHLSSNYTTTLIPLGLELIARVWTPAAPAWACCYCSRASAPACSGLITTLIMLGNLYLRRRSGPRGLSKVHIKLKAEQRRS